MRLYPVKREIFNPVNNEIDVNRRGSSLTKNGKSGENSYRSSMEGLTHLNNTLKNSSII